jgi:hypothetical protein
MGFWDKFKSEIQSIQSIVAIVAVLVGGFWTYNLFVKERKPYPHAIIEQHVTHVKYSEGINLLRLDIEFTNTG